MLREGELIVILAIVSGLMARLRLYARLRWRFARWTLFHGGRSALYAMRCQNRVEGSVTAITFRRNSAGNRRQKRIKVTILSFNPGSSQGRDDKARRIAANIAK